MPTILAHMRERPTQQVSVRPAHCLVHSICLRALGFVWMFSACLVLVSGLGLALLGVGGHLLVRARPDAGNVINYDPSTVATFSPLPIAVGTVMSLGFVLRARR